MESLIEIIDLLLMPSSLLRFTYDVEKEGYFKIKKEPHSQFMKSFLKVYPYMGASVWETARLYGYYELFKNLF